MTGAASFIGGIRNISLSGVLTTSSVTNPVTSSTRTITGNGTLLFNNVFAGPGTPQYSLNGGAFANITEGMTLAVVTSDTLAVRANNPTAGDNSGFDLRNNANGLRIEAVSLQKL